MSNPPSPLTLQDFGWKAMWDTHVQHWPQGTEAGRVLIDYGTVYLVMTASGEQHAEPTGTLRLTLQNNEQSRPAVGDWVQVSPSIGEGRWTLHSLLPRRSQIVRKASGRREVEQVVAANVDKVFITTALDADLSPRRLERYLTMVYEGQAQPIVLLTKADLCKDLSANIAMVREVTGDVPVFALSMRTGLGLQTWLSSLVPGETVVFVGSSGVGKSTLINHLAGQNLQLTQAVREDGKGRHTTTHRTLLRLDSGVIVIDTPGMRELALWEVEDSALSDTFDDVVPYAKQCRFGDCSHGQEPGCGVKSAITKGLLTQDRVAAYQALKVEINAPKRAKLTRRKHASES